MLKSAKKYLPLEIVKTMYCREMTDNAQSHSCVLVKDLSQAHLEIDSMIGIDHWKTNI